MTENDGRLDKEDDARPKAGRAISKNTISIRTYSIPDSPPKTLAFSEHLMRFTGLKLFSVNPDLIWGVQGTTSLNRADAFASMDAQHKKRRVYQIELSYKLNGLPPAGTSVTEEFAEKFGYLHFNRLTSSYRKSLHLQMLAWLGEERDAELQFLNDLDFEDLVKSRPMMVHRLMERKPHVNTVIHSVELPGGASLRIATVRNLPQNIARVYTRFHEDIITTV